MSTKQCNYKGSTEFSLWLRDQSELDSSLGYITSDLDHIWMNYKNELWMLLETKRYGWYVGRVQHNILLKINKACAKDKMYRGLHQLVFENTTPDDGRIQLDEQEITKEELIKFLQFDQKIIDRYYKHKTEFITLKFTPKIVENLEKLKK